MDIQFKGGWIVSLNNGETILEGEPVKGERTPWQQLIERTKSETFKDKNGVETPLKITGMRLQRHGITFTAMPHKMCNGYMAAYEVKKSFFGSISRDITIPGSGEQIYQGIGSVVDELVFLIWVPIAGAFDSPHVYQEVRPLHSCKIHTTLR